jgi:hypothetical protein
MAVNFLARNTEKRAFFHSIFCPGKNQALCFDANLLRRDGDGFA